VKDYPAYRLARAPMPQADSDRDSQNSAFRVLFDHIKENQIAMTAPVEMTYSTDDTQTTQPSPATDAYRQQSMAFLYGDMDMGEPGRDGDVEVIDVPPMKVVSIGVKGGYTTQRFAEAKAKLDAWLSERDAAYKPAGPPRYLGYNSPFVPVWMRYGEVQIPIEPRR